MFPRFRKIRIQWERAARNRTWCYSFLQILSRN